MSVPPWANSADNAHVLSPAELQQVYAVERESGLSDAEAESRLEFAGENILSEAPPRSALAVLISQFRSVLILILIIAAIVAAIAGDIKDGIVILAVIVLNALLGFYQEYRAEHSLAALRGMLPRTAHVRRNGQIHEIPARKVVPGDILTIDAGERVSADARILLSAALQIDESGLTGESAPVYKNETASLPEETPLADRTNCVFMNTVATHGRAELLVTATGMTTFMGRLSQSLEQARETRSPLQRQLDQAGRRLGIIAVVLVALLFVLSIARGEELAQVVLKSVSLAVAAIPEGLPAVVTITLALGMHRMARQHALIKRLASVETLGCATVICSDKTGTLTVNEMTVKTIALGPDNFTVTGEGYGLAGEITPKPTGAQTERFSRFLKAAVLCNDSQLIDGQIIGDPTEVALLILACKAGTDPAEIRARYPRIAELPFDSAHKFMATAHRDGSNIHIFVKGAPDVLLSRCDGNLQDASGTDGAAQAAADHYQQIAAKSMRGLLLADAVVPAATFDPGQLTVDGIAGLRLLGIVGIVDPPRPEARDAIERCRRAGIDVKMITGDHPDTAAAIGRDLGLTGGVLTGAELAAMTPDQLTQIVGQTAVFARVAPEHKVRIVQVLQTQGHVVAMTGDGVNDAPALKIADIGVAMGKKGSDVAKEAAAMILTDDNFATIVRAVREGRGLYDNIIKFVRFQLSTTIGAIMTVFLAPLLGLPDPLTPVQILWVAMIMDGPPAVALALDSPRPGLMAELPRNPDDQILSVRRLVRLMAYGSIMTIGTLGMLSYGIQEVSHAYGLTLCFATFVFFQVFNVFNARVEQGSTFNRRFFDNGLLWSSLCGVMILQALAIYWQPAAQIFDTVALTPHDFGLAIAVASSILFLDEGRKLILRTYRSTVKSTG